MKVFALISIMGIVTGEKKLIGLYSTKRKAEKVKKEVTTRNSLFPWVYSIIELEIDETLNIVFAEW